MKNFNHPIVPYLTLAMLGTSCGGIGDSGAEIWMFQRSWTPSKQSISYVHNYLGAVEAENGVTQWTYAQSNSSTGVLLFGAVVERAGGKVLLLDGNAYPGTNESGSTWIFQWVAEEETVNQENHISGYTFVETGRVTETRTLNLDLTGNEATGTWTRTVTEVQTFAESDRWNENETINEAGVIGQTPVYNYLRDADRDPIENESHESDCTDAKCQFTVTVATTENANLTAELTDFAEDEMALEWVAGVGEGPGLEW